MPVTSSYIFKTTEQGNQVFAYTAVSYTEYVENSNGGEPLPVTYTNPDKKVKFSDNEDKPTASNYDKFSQYKFTFTKNSDSTLKFDKIERIK